MTALAVPAVTESHTMATGTRMSHEDMAHPIGTRDIDGDAIRSIADSYDDEV